MKKKRMAKSVRKFIRREKARIRREVSDVKNQEEQITKLYDNTSIKPKIEAQKNQDKKINPKLKLSG